VAAFPFVSGAEAGLIVCEGWDGTVGNGVVDRLAEAMLEGAPTGTASVDYIHGDSELLALCREPNRIGVLLGSPEKAGFMRYVGERGPYPKKSFSMGLAKDKRHYLECRRID
ncbi:MAG: hypothetical protein FWE70_04015, partial [Oscillospiraceae bacterium]|nr:hypothetical protein [Oscillospiraceae bacterium]